MLQTMRNELNMGGNDTWCVYVSTLKSLINVALRLLILRLFIQGYFLIREATFINFHCLFQGLYMLHVKIILKAKNHCFRTYFLVVFLISDIKLHLLILKKGNIY